MEQAQGTEQVSTSVETTETAIQASPVETTSNQSEVTATSAGEGSQEQVQTYQPNFKFWADKKEYEIPEKFRALVTDEASEKEIKDILQKAHGIEGVKELREQIKGEFKTYKEQAEPTLQVINQAAQSYQRSIKSFNEGNHPSALMHMDATLQHLGISERAMQQYVLLKLKQADADPALKDAYNRQQASERQYWEQQNQLTQTQTQLQQFMVQQRTSELNQALSKPEIASIVQNFDQRNGQGAFQNEVILQGQLHFQRTGQDIPADQLVTNIVQKYFAQGQQTQSPQAPAVVTPQKDLPVIPVAKGGAGNPVARKPKTLRDLEAYAKTLKD